MYNVRLIVSVIQIREAIFIRTFDIVIRIFFSVNGAFCRRDNSFMINESSHSLQPFATHL